MEKRDKLIQDTAVKAGSILLSSGAEIYRVEETVKRIAAYYGLKNEHTFVLSNGIFLTAETLKGEIYAQVRHIPINSMNLKKNNEGQYAFKRNRTGVLYGRRGMGKITEY